MSSTIITILILLLVVTTFIAIKLSYLQKRNDSIIKLLKEQNQLLKSNKGLKNEKIQMPVLTPENKIEESSELKTFTAKEVTIRRKSSKKTERLSIEQWMKKKKIYGKDAYEIIEYHG